MPDSLITRLCAPLYEPHDLPLYAVALLIPLLGAALSFLSSDCSPAAVRWRQSLRKSRFSPSAAATAVIWFTLYVFMGHSSYLVYTSLDPRSMLAPSLIAYLVQCLLNHFYIIVLFGLQRIDLSLLMIFPLWLSTGITALFFYDVSQQAGLLMTAVFAWVSVNIYFNVVLFLNNPVYTEVDLPPLPPSSTLCQHSGHGKIS